jgi:hypothetical protein
MDGLAGYDYVFFPGSALNSNKVKIFQPGAECARARDSSRNSTGYTPQQQSDITQQSLGAANTAFDALRQSTANLATARNDTAGCGDLTAQLGREQARPTRAPHSKIK